MAPSTIRPVSGFIVKVIGSISATPMAAERPGIQPIIIPMATPAAIIRKLQLDKPQYRALAAYGHMGRTALGVKWEDTDKADELRKAAANY